MNAKKGMSNLSIAVLLVVIIALVYFVGLPFIGMFNTGEFSIPGGSTVKEKCDTGETQSLDLNAFALGAPGTALTENNNIIRKVGGAEAPSTYTEGTAVTGLEAGGSYEVIVGAGTTDYDNAYGPYIQISNLPCVMSESLVLFNDEIETSVTGTFYNKDGNAAYQALTASTPVTVSVEFYTADKEYFGNPYIGEVDYIDAINEVGWSTIKKDRITYNKGSAIGSHSPEYPNIVCVTLNASNHNEPLWVKALLPNGLRVEMDKVAEPGVHSDTSGDNDWCYEAPVLSVDASEIEIRLDPKADVAGADDGTLSIYAASWWVHTETGEVSWGVEDNDENAIGASDPDTVTLDFTA